ncbi:tetratricopeptide repeat protein [Luteolibacter pohnpeiensis]|uniref:Tetratricopeptide repeat protein n=1 Tax=Luteolibacter pohnpeiensis TaxID=454153 RepID=A0A934S8Z9_9BACT|nr:tetratricopeptide repeat protein [Luteolibacter pohnpeiensis]MBK1881028.1 tetratricopeptide repeat protein [Luteolibacter pohnpeiensis]
MRYRRPILLPAKAIVFAALLGVGSPDLLCAQTTAPVHPTQLDPSDIFLQAYMLRRSADELQQSGNYREAWEKMSQAQELIETIRHYHPDWKKSMVEGRYENNKEAASELKPKAEKQAQEERAKLGGLAELEGGDVKSGEFIDPSDGVAPLSSPGILEVDPLATRRLEEAEAEVKRLKGLLANSNQAARDASRLHDVERQRDALNSQLSQAEARERALRAKLAAQPMRNEFNQLNDRIQSLEMEGEALRKALNQSRESNLEAETRRQTLEADLNAMKKKVADMNQKEADLTRDLQVQQDVANDLVAGQRRQLEELGKQLDQKTSELKKANDQIADLKVELQQSKDAFDQLRDERDNLLQERDQMAALLKLNETDRINELIEQNVGLVKQLREANEKVDRLNLDNNATKDDQAEALRDLAIAKSQINGFQEEKRKQAQRLDELQARLRHEEGTLATGSSGMSSEEADVLRNLIKRQLVVQERHKQAREVLEEAAKELGSKDERLAQAIDFLKGEELVLSPEEQKLIADRNVDGHFISPMARDRESVGRATAALEQEEQSYNRAAVKAFAKGRFFPAKVLFETMVESNPGDVSALCKLGVVELKLKDFLAAVDVFRRATELDPKNAYSFRMLGLSLMQIGDLASAETAAKRATELAPDDSLAFMVLAQICYQQGQPKDSIAYFKAAINADPVSSAPYYNLALLYQMDGRLDEAREYYEKALERGEVPDPALEKKIEIKPSATQEPANSPN